MDLNPGDLFPDPCEEILAVSDNDLILPNTDLILPGAGDYVRPAETDEASLKLRSRVYGSFLTQLSLQERHRRQLRDRGLDNRQIDTGNYRSLSFQSRKKALESLQRTFSKKQLKSVPGFVVDKTGKLAITPSVQGLVIPIVNVDKRTVALKVRRDSSEDGCGKYMYLSGGDGPSCGSPTHVPWMLETSVSEVRLTEGELKADVATVISGVTTIGIAGVNCWRQALPVLKELETQTVRLAFDADWVTKPQVARCLVECATALRTHGYNVVIERWPIEQGKGIDDLFNNGHQPEVLVGEEVVAFLARIGDARVQSVITPHPEIAAPPAASNRLQPGALIGDGPPPVQSVSPTSSEIVAPPATGMPLAASTPAGTASSVLPFPISVFPARLQRYARCVAESLGCPVDLVCMPMLVMVATAIGASRALEAKPGWRESPRIYGATVAAPGSSKSPAETAVSRPVFKIQNRYRREYEQAKAAYKAAETQQRPQVRGRRAASSSEASRYAVAPPVVVEAIASSETTVDAGANPVPPCVPSMPPQPHLRRVTTCDATTESLAPILSKNPRGIVKIQDELTGWIRSLDQYKGGKGADRQFYLSCWSGQAAIVDRKSQAEPVIVARPFLNVLGGIQPDMLSVLMDEHGRADGFMDRILFAFPDPCVTHRWTDQGVDSDVERDWEDTLELLFHLEMVHCEDEGIDFPQTVRFTADGKAVWVRWYDTQSAEMESPELPANLKGPWSKLRSYCLRLSLVVHLVRYACREVNSEDVDAESVGHAIKLIDYFKSHARKVYSFLHRGPEDRRADQALTWIRNHGGACSARDFQRAKVAGITKTSDAGKILKDLADRGFGELENRTATNGKVVTHFVLTVPSSRVE